MKYSKKFKLKCIRMYKNGQRIPDDWFTSTRDTFHRKVRTWIKLYDAFGAEGITHPKKNRKWTPEEKLALVSKVLAGESASAAAIEAGMASSLLLAWIKKYRENGADGLQSLKRGRPKMTKAKKPKPKGCGESESEELRRLREENERLEMENAYLKKLRALAAKAAQAKASDAKPSAKSPKRGRDGGSGRS